MAYTLLTFAYLIPHGLQNWGCTWSQDEKEAFLHLWKTVGYIIGVEERLMTDSWEEAEALFLQLREQQAGPSEDGRWLTDALIHFLQDYLPTALAPYVPPLLIQSQLGSRYADMILPELYRQAYRNLLARLAFGLFSSLIRTYYVVRNILFHRSPTMATFMGNVFSQAGEALINSWRDVYARRPFYLPMDAYTWGRRQGVQDEMLQPLRAWRSKLFSTVAAGIGFLLLSKLSLIVLVILLLLDRDSHLALSAWFAGSCFLLGVGILKITVPRISQNRPSRLSS